MRKKIDLVAGSIQTKEALIAQLNEYLDERFEITGYAIDGDDFFDLDGDLVILSSEFVYEELRQLNRINDAMEMIIARRTINSDYLDPILEIKDQTKVYFVNELPDIVYDVIEQIKDIGIHHLQWLPYYPDIDQKDTSIKIAVTPGERKLVPDFIEEIYDIGPRIMDFTTITKILNKLDILDEKAGQFSLRYLQKTTHIAQRLAESKQKILMLNQHLESVIDGLSDGLLVFDKKGLISVSNENFKKILNSSMKLHVGRNLNEILKNHELLTYLLTDEFKDDYLLIMNQKEFTVSKMAINSSSVLARFRSVKETIDETERLKRELIKKGYYAKYTFDEIIGKSNEMVHVKNVAKRLASSELTILIYGESGTGKELFASSIHNDSIRKTGPFLAVNFSALSDDLIESELFGYEEGAFTGAKKGGKAGLFEQADGGTIFLDEIGDISMKLQARLLRVLQEKEVMRVGGTAIKTIDVRVIAATNKNLQDKVINGEFREDLYHRLKMGFIKLPPLRNRKSDLPDLIYYLLKEQGAEGITIEPVVLDKLYHYNWYGNVRELRNTIEYMIAVSDRKALKLTDFPDSDFFDYETTFPHTIQPCVKVENGQVSPLNQFILQRVLYYNQNDILCGRDRLSRDSANTHYELSENQMRTRLRKMAEKGWIALNKGKKGTVITEKGIGVLMANNINGEVMVDH
ncbi:MAG: sigma 54-interacting transcriptional regulator [Clostridia bacterium]|nr:sigma 54-interacting transcriptional regulator [Clostridia bacterium]